MPKVGFRHSEESKKKMSIAKSGRVRPLNPLFDATISPSDENIAWAAGLYEGEGSVKSEGASFTIGIVQKDPWILTELRDWFGGKIHQRSNGMSVWYIHGERARIFMWMIYERLSPRRQQQVPLGLREKFMSHEGGGSGCLSRQAR